MHVLGQVFALNFVVKILYIDMIKQFPVAKSKKRKKNQIWKEKNVVVGTNLQRETGDVHIKSLCWYKQEYRCRQKASVLIRNFLQNKPIVTIQQADQNIYTGSLNLHGLYNTRYFA